MLIRKQEQANSMREKLLSYQSLQEETKNQSIAVEWLDKLWIKRLLRLSALFSFCSVSLNTPKTFELYPFLRPVTFVCDLITGLLFSAEMIIKISTRGLLPKGEDSYLRNRWCLFDSCMLLFLWISVILQTLELSTLVPYPSYLSILRAPRSLIMIRSIRVFFRPIFSSMPKSRMNQIFKRLSQQIYDVAFFFFFFVLLFGMLGVQFFGELRNHCIQKGTNPDNITVNSLTIPDTYCSINSSSGYQCPEGTVCTKLKSSRFKLGFSGFDEIATSIFTVYQIFSQEGWAYIMYRAMDTLPDWRAYLYFMTVILFLSVLVKSVFIAVVAETFSEIRGQFNQMWRQHGSQADTVEAFTLIISGDDRGWEMVATRHQYPIVLLFLSFLNSATFHLLVMMAILANGLVTAFMSFKHDGRPRSDFYQQHYYIEVGFTIFFDMEALFKIWCLGFRNYYGRTVYKFELFLVIGTTLHILPPFYLSALASFQVLRVVRMIKAFWVLEEFVYKIFGPGKKFGSLILLTMCLLIIISSISMQLFCSLADFTKFETFPEAFMCMFQILIQEGWVEVMDETMRHTSENIAPVVAVYFILYHLFVTLIVLSLFVAVILDNLELNEDIKKLKQMKARVQRAEIKKGLPIRLRLFQNFLDHPKMARLKYVNPGFKVPKIRDSFLSQFMSEKGDI